ncbi:glutathionylspermidine synthase family protein [Sphaerisporangium sp. TRM90804]|uniref:glutathionylspermidine synthase family protein n=1 Tax=Sphaerisporangium sp. TRM90804 TaxID=3031113 RepID=UPI00244881CE|nr:glutathionylspermidine synthase family protein [Sphaerisporangium sp. TRM90804]MDH2424840.1 glutathionylspermidine synthase family protein [Sphaerisporangium sp. TRM90804]
MRRELGDRRPGWEALVESQGLGFHRSVAPGYDGRPYWDEAAHYVFTMAEVLDLEAAVEELHDMCLKAVDWVIKRKRYADFGIPEWCWEPIRASWKRHDPHLYGRFDLCYDGAGHAKLLEYNADTPTSLVEASVIQWFWLQDVHPDSDQWNSIHEKLAARWQKLAAPGGTAHFAWTATDESGEDALNVAYLQDTAQAAGLRTTAISMEDIGWDTGREQFVDLENRPIGSLFKLYPWEWMISDPFGQSAVERQANGSWMEPLWKMLLSNKALLAVLWEMYPDHPNLLPAYLDGPRELSAYVRKPLLGREGASMRIVTPGQTQDTPGEYGAEGYVYQEFWPLPDFDGWHPVLGAWVVGDEAAGVGIRETRGLITDNTSSFVPHRIDT